jgi:hypothetical protein
VALYLFVLHAVLMVDFIGSSLGGLMGQEISLCIKYEPGKVKAEKKTKSEGKMPSIV